jgi:predicted PurR-regulated permease PerM
MSHKDFNKVFVLILFLLISAVFLAMIWQFLLTIIMAGIFSSLCYPLYRRLERWFGGRRSLAAGVTLFLIVFGILVPLTGFLGLVTAEAINVGETVKPWIQRQVTDPPSLSETLKSLPFYESLLPYRQAILTKAGELVGRLSSYLINSLSAVTVMTVQFLFMTFIFLYTMFFFLVDGKRILKAILRYLPLKPEDEERMLDKFTSVTRATLKGVAVIGILQGVLAGAAFAVVGIPGAVFWGTVMTVFSIIPGVGAPLIWVPAVIILATSGNYGQAIGLALFCGLVVGSVDNLLRPRLVGKDTRMHELLIFFGTLGGIIMFGPAGVIIGPIIAALVVTVWEIYGLAFGDVLPADSGSPAGGQPAPGEPRILLADSQPDSRDD